MKLALVTTPWNSTSPAGERTRELARELVQIVELHVFVERGREGDYFGLATRAADTLVPKAFDHVLYEVGNEREHAFMAQLVRRLGGCVALSSWELPELAAAARPELERGGWRGRLAAWREGGFADARALRRDARSLAGLTLNRSIVRFGDTFIVGDESLRARVLDDRNAPTPIGIVASSLTARERARAYVELFERFPPPRTARKGLLTLRVRAALADRQDAQRTDGVRR